MSLGLHFSASKNLMTEFDFRTNKQDMFLLLDSAFQARSDVGIFPGLRLKCGASFSNFLAFKYRGRGKKTSLWTRAILDLSNLLFKLAMKGYNQIPLPFIVSEYCRGINWHNSKSIPLCLRQQDTLDITPRDQVTNWWREPEDVTRPIRY